MAVVGDCAILQDEASTLVTIGDVVEPRCCERRDPGERYILHAAERLGRHRHDQPNRNQGDPMHSLSDSYSASSRESHRKM